MKVKTKLSGILYIFLSSIFFITRCYSQDLLVLKKGDISKYKIRTITILKKTRFVEETEDITIDSCLRWYSFENGQLTKESYYARSFQDTAFNRYYYYGDSLIVKDLYGWGGTTQYGMHYRYKNGRMRESFETKSHYNDDGSKNDENQSEDDFHKYFYNSDGELIKNSSVEYNGKHSKLNASTYYLYKDRNLIGYFPARDESSNGLTGADTIYYRSKLNELKKIGIEKFARKYFSDEVYKKIINDCYTPIKNEELLINNAPITSFLSEIRKNSAKLLVFEIADNYFLFYKLTD